MKRRLIFLPLLLILGLSCGCVKLADLKQTGVETTYYTLEYDPPATTTAEQISDVPTVNRFTAAPLFSSKKIIYKRKKYQTGEYLYHQWHVRPAEEVASLLTRDMRQSGLFPAVIGPAGVVPATVSISGNLESFLEDDTRTPWQAVLSLEIRLIDETEPDIDKRVLMQKVYTAAEPCAGKNPRATAEAMSRAMQRMSGKIVRDIYDRLKERTQQR